MSVSFPVETDRPCLCLLLYTESLGEPYSFVKAVSVAIRAGGMLVDVPLPVERLECLRMDVRNISTGIRAGPMRIRGAEERVLDWNNFRHRKNVSHFAVGDDGFAEIVPDGDEFYVAHVPDVDAEPLERPNAFAILCLVLAAEATACFLSCLAGVLRGWARGRPSAGTVVFFAAAAALVALRLALTSGIPPCFYGSEWDDLLFAKTGISLAGGHWLGSYDHHTLAKGSFGPAVLAASMLAGVPFLAMETLLYVAGCALFVFALSHSIRSRPFLLAAFSFLLFNPVSFSMDAWQRLYRNGMPLWQVPLVVGCLFLTFCSCREPVRRWLKWPLFAGFALWAFLNTREDGAWIGPLALSCMALSAGRAAAAGSTRRRKAARACSCFLPVAVVLCGNALLCLVNWSQYGLPLRNDRDAGNYAKAMEDLYLISPNPDDEARLSSPEHDGCYHNIYYSTLCKAYDASPTLAGARRKIDAAIDAWSRHSGQHGLDLRYDHILFAIRNGVFDAGHYASLRDGEAFWAAVHGELSKAFADGRLERRGKSITALAAPFRPGRIPRIIREWAAALAELAVFWKRRVPPRPEWVDPGDPDGRGFVDPRIAPVFEKASGVPIPVKGGTGPVLSKLARAQRVADVYVSAVPWEAAAALAAYAVLSFLIGFRPRFRRLILDEWILATGLLGSILAHAAGIAYISATTFPATRYYYMAASCQMLLLFAVVVAAMVLRATECAMRRPSPPLGPAAPAAEAPPPESGAGASAP